MVFRVLAGILAAFLLLVGVPMALYGGFTRSGESQLGSIFWAGCCLFAGLGLAGGARTGRWYNVRA